MFICAERGNSLTTWYRSVVGEKRIADQCRGRDPQPLPWPGFEPGLSRPQREVLTTIRSRPFRRQFRRARIFYECQVRCSLTSTLHGSLLTNGGQSTSLLRLARFYFPISAKCTMSCRRWNQCQIISIHYVINKMTSHATSNITQFKLFTQFIYIYIN